MTFQQQWAEGGSESDEAAPITDDAVTETPEAEVATDTAVNGADDDDGENA